MRHAIRVGVAETGERIFEAEEGWLFGNGCFVGLRLH